MLGSVCRYFKRKISKNSPNQLKITPILHNIGSFQLFVVALWWQSMGWKIFLSQNQLITHVWVHFQKAWKKNIKNQRRSVESNPEGIEVIWYRLLLAPVYLKIWASSCQVQNRSYFWKLDLGKVLHFQNNHNWIINPLKRIVFQDLHTLLANSGGS